MKMRGCKSLSTNLTSILKNGLIANNLYPLGTKQNKLLAINAKGGLIN